jgi:hypothetical protein
MLTRSLVKGLQLHWGHRLMLQARIVIFPRILQLFVTQLAVAEFTLLHDHGVQLLALSLQKTASLLREK